MTGKEDRRGTGPKLLSSDEFRRTVKALLDAEAEITAVSDKLWELGWEETQKLSPIIGNHWLLNLALDLIGVPPDRTLEDVEHGYCRGWHIGDPFDEYRKHRDVDKFIASVLESFETDQN